MRGTKGWPIKERLTFRCQRRVGLKCLNLDFSVQQRGSIETYLLTTFEARLSFLEANLRRLLSEVLRLLTGLL